MSEQNTLDPILVLIRRGRNGRGFSVSPIEDIANPALCADGSEIGEVIIEMLNDPSQPRVDVNSLLGSAQGPASDTVREDSPRRARHEEYDPAGDEEEDDRETMGVQGDLADRLILQTLSAVLGKGRSMSSARVRPSGPRRKKKKA